MPRNPQTRLRLPDDVLASATAFAIVSGADLSTVVSNCVRQVLDESEHSAGPLVSQTVLKLWKAFEYMNDQTITRDSELATKTLTLIATTLLQMDIGNPHALKITDRDSQHLIDVLKAIVSVPDEELKRGAKVARSAMRKAS